jgi:hypothetical protein
MAKRLERLHCTSCGSTQIERAGDLYRCLHCKSTFHPPKRQRDLGTIALVALLLVIVFLGYFYIEASKKELVVEISNAHQERSLSSQPKIIATWDRIYNKERVTKITDMETTPHDTYLVTGYSIDQLTWIAELNATGEVIWENHYPNNVNRESRVLALNDRYILSQKRLKDGKSFLLDRNRKVITTLPYYFASMVATKEGFMGVSAEEIISFDRDGTLLHRARFVGVRFDQLVRLNEGDFVAMGAKGNEALVLVKVDALGKKRWEQQIPYHRLYTIEDAIATSDGGFMLNARGKIDMMKFSSEGVLEFRTKVTQYRYSYAETIVETPTGYLSTNQINQGADILLLKLDFDGNIVEDRIYSSDKRLHADELIGAIDGGYLLSIDTEIHNVWLVKLDERAEIEVDFSQEITTYQGVSRKVKKRQVEPLKSHFNYIGGNLRSLQHSNDGRYLYALTGATGLKIFDVSDIKRVKEVGGFQKSQLQLKVTPNYIAPIGRKYADQYGAYAYDAPAQLILSKDEHFAYILDRNHGFYILDIANKHAPKLVGESNESRGGAFALSGDERRAYMVEGNRIKVLNLTNVEAITSYYLPYVAKMDHAIVDIYLSKSEELLYFSDVDHLVVYDIKKSKVVAKEDLMGQIYRLVYQKETNRLYLSHRLGFSGYALGSDEYPNHFFDISYKERVRDFEFSHDLKRLFICVKDGVEVYDITTPTNPILKRLYATPLKEMSYTLTPSSDYRYLYMGFAHGVIARIEL